ncbi:MAG: hypothetical protein JXB62_08450 [Pirellulales bacterium]|nr:hypothetical protein [Pirellulales bacterium]
MSHVDLVQCSNCKCPISSHSIVCPYCHAAIAHPLSWKQRALTWAVFLLCALLLIWCSDRYLGTHLFWWIGRLLAGRGS